MALRRIISKRFSVNKKPDSPAFSIQIAPENNFRRDILVNSPESEEQSFLSRFLFRRSINHQSARKLPDFLFAPVGDRLREKLWTINDPAGNPFRYNLNVPAPSGNLAGISVCDVKKIWRSSQMEKLRSKLREIQMSSIAYSDFVEICAEVCENRDQGLQCAKMLDDAGNVIVLGKLVYLRPDQVARSMEKVLSESAATPSDPRKEELEKMEKEKQVIDKKAESEVRRKLYCGLAFMLLQTLGFMRLTFWELSWDVMEPICFFVTSLHFALAYGFFLRTSKEPTFESFFQRRFLVKQAKLMKIYKFDVEKYRKLCKVFYPDYNDSASTGRF